MLQTLSQVSAAASFIISLLTRSHWCFLDPFEVKEDNFCIIKCLVWLVIWFLAIMLCRTWHEMQRVLGLGEQRDDWSPYILCWLPTVFYRINWNKMEESSHVCELLCCCLKVCQRTSNKETRFCEWLNYLDGEFDVSKIYLGKRKLIIACD